MANLEDEMSRFEQEILGAGGGGGAGDGASSTSILPPVIGASTFTSVQEQLSALRAQVYGVSNNTAAQQQPTSSSPNVLSPATGMNSSQLPGHMSAPPRPPGFRPPHVNGQPSNTRPMSGPPPPPSLRGPTSPFVPSQLKSRGPPPPLSMSGNFANSVPQRPPMQRPPMMAQARPPPGMSGMPLNMMNLSRPQSSQHNSLSGQPVRYSQPSVVSAPKVVYTSKPVLNKPGKTEQQMESNSQKRDAEDPINPSSSTSNNSIAAAAEPSTSTTSLADPGQLPPAAKKDKKGKAVKDKRIIRTAANEVWEDHSLMDWDPNDFRVFCGDLGNEVTDEKLAEAFKKYPSLQRTKVIRDRRTHKTKGYGFISFKDPTDYTRAMREMNGKYVGNRPIKLRKSTWKDRNIDVVKKKEKEKKKLGFR